MGSKPEGSGGGEEINHCQCRRPDKTNGCAGALEELRAT